MPLIMILTDNTDFVGTPLIEMHNFNSEHYPPDSTANPTYNS